MFVPWMSDQRQHGLFAAAVQIVDLPSITVAASARGTCAKWSMVISDCPKGCRGPGAALSQSRRLTACRLWI